MLFAVPSPADLSERAPSAERAAHLAAQADKCRRLARSCTDAPTADALTELAGEYEDQVRALSAPA